MNCTVTDPRQPFGTCIPIGAKDFSGIILQSTGQVVTRTKSTQPGTNSWQGHCCTPKRENEGTKADAAMQEHVLNTKTSLTAPLEPNKGQRTRKDWSFLGFSSCLAYGLQRFWNSTLAVTTRAIGLSDVQCTKFLRAACPVAHSFFFCEAPQNLRRETQRESKQ